MKSALIGAAALALCAVSAHAQTTKLTALPSGWDTSHLNAPLQHVSGWRLAFDDEFKYRSVGADNVPGSNWYAPIHTKLGAGNLAQASDTAAISVDKDGLELQTRNPDMPGGVDANVESMDNHGHGFSFTNGYVEVEAALPAAHGSHAGVWFLNTQGAQGHGEVDAPETYGAADHVWSRTVHWWPTAASRFANEVHAARYAGMTPATYYAQLHRWGALFMPTEIILYDDSQCALGPTCPLQERGRIARLPESVAPMYILLSNFTDANRHDGYQPSKMTVRYVKAWGK